MERSGWCRFLSWTDTHLGLLGSQSCDPQYAYVDKQSITHVKVTPTLGNFPAAEQADEIILTARALVMVSVLEAPQEVYFARWKTTD